MVFPIFFNLSLNLAIRIYTHTHTHTHTHIYIYVWYMCMYMCVCVYRCIHILLNLFLQGIPTNTQLTPRRQTFPKCSHHSNVPECSGKCQSWLQVKAYSHLRVNWLQWKHLIKDLQNPGTIGTQWLEMSFQGLRRHCTKDRPSCLS